MELSGNYYIGKVSIKRHPSVYWASSTRLPPILSIMRRLRASPNPVPFENVSNLANRSNTKSCLSWGNANAGVSDANHDLLLFGKNAPAKCNTTFFCKFCCVVQ